MTTITPLVQDLIHRIETTTLDLIQAIKDGDLQAIAAYAKLNAMYSSRLVKFTRDERRSTKITEITKQKRIVP